SPRACPKTSGPISWPNPSRSSSLSLPSRRRWAADRIEADLKPLGFGTSVRGFGLPLAAGTRLGLAGAARRAALFGALDAFAADRLEEGFEIIAAVIVGDLVARLDVLDRAQDDLTVPRGVGLRIRPAGMVGVARDVAAGRTVEGPG